MQNKPDNEAIEARLRYAAPSLPPELRQRVLQQCRQERRKKPKFAWFGHWRPAGAFAGFILFCWMASSSLDAQSRAMIAGTSGLQPDKSLTIHSNSPAVWESGSPSFGVALQWRLRQLALLLRDKHSG